MTAITAVTSSMLSLNSFHTMSSHPVDHVAAPLHQSPFVQQVQRVCAHLHRHSITRGDDISMDIWNEAVGSADDLTKDFLRAHGTPTSLHDYFTACTNRGVSVDEAAAMNTDDQLREEHRGFASWLQRHQFSTCAQWRLAGLADSDYQLLRQQPDDANLFDSLRFDLDYDDDPDEARLHTELYWYYNPARAPLTFVIYTQMHILFAPSMEASMFKRRSVDSQRVQ